MNQYTARDDDNTLLGATVRLWDAYSRAGILRRFIIRRLAPDVDAAARDIAEYAYQRTRTRPTVTGMFRKAS